MGIITLEPLDLLHTQPCGLGYQFSRESNLSEVAGSGSFFFNAPLFHSFGKSFL